MFDIFADYKNQNADNGLDKSGDTNGDYLFTARVQTSLKEEWKIKKIAESFLGKDGFHHQLGLEFGVWTDAKETTNDVTVTPKLQPFPSITFFTTTKSVLVLT